MIVYTLYVTNEIEIRNPIERLEACVVPQRCDVGCDTRLFQASEALFLIGQPARQHFVFGDED
ncbi:hypothetical protein NBEOAGPD_1451 [Methylobacterium gregans]|uniref:Uncharacterized protein n=1 Tax=Methylobacterium gregans TaxID=374424 RepID=A0AA37HLW9_9HYPH|nr:hypothetical protein NBEOAGPD_1451 [Methylobacterium gregans]